MPPLFFGGHEFGVAGGRALYWPHRRALIVADLHLEKASWFARRGQMLPPHDSLATLEAVAALVEQLGVREVWCLGDNFHDSRGIERMTRRARDLLDTLTTGLAWNWIVGNHDEDLPSGVGGTVLEESVVDGLVLRHRADRQEMRPELSGHYHPKHRAEARGRAVSRPCFVANSTKLILPAFGALTGGLDSRHRELAVACGQGAALVPAGNRLLRFPLAA